jgi:2-polyprenyl-3-methyl-5-hydroxy-6-metoxy-1,4-benzoquinol methylase
MPVLDEPREETGAMRVHRLGHHPLVSREDFLEAMAAGQRVLHLGCADAPLSAERLRSGSLLHTRLARVAQHIVGVDVSGEAVALLREQGGLSDILVGDVEALDRLGLQRVFDVVIAGELLEHLRNPGLCLEGVRRVLVPAGRLVVSVPNAFAVKAFLRVLGGVELVHRDHVAYFSTATMARLLEANGFETVWSGYYAVRPASLAKRLVDSLLVGPVRRAAPRLADGLVFEARAR